MPTFGKTLRQVVEDLRSDDLEALEELGAEEREEKKDKASGGDDHISDFRERIGSGDSAWQGGPRSRAIMQIVVSLIVLVAGFSVLANGSDEAGKAAAGLIGAVVGYWLS
jgi:hypothetical protein